VETRVQNDQLTFDFDAEDRVHASATSSPSASSAEAVCRPPRADPVTAALVRSSVYADARERQAVSGRHAMPEHQVVEVARSIRERAAKLDPVAIKDSLAAVLGIAREVVDDVALSADAGSVIWVDIDRACAHHDYSRLFAAQAARPGDPDHYRPATWQHAKPFPPYLGAALHAARAAVPGARRIGVLLPNSHSTGADAVVDLGGYKLRATMARFRAALPSLLLDAGIDRLEAALVTGAMHVLPRSRIYYAQTTPERLHHAYEVLYQILGWGPAAPPAGATPIGSASVPTPEAVKRVHDALQSRLERRPRGGCHLRTLMRFHNRFITAAGLTLTFCTGARAMRRIGISARYWRPGIDHVEHDDKSSEHELLMDVALCRVARDTVVNVYAHLRELRARLRVHRGRVPKQWTESVDAALRYEDVPLLMKFSRRHARPLSTADLRAAIGDRQGEGNWGRKFWQTELLLRGVCTEDINDFARHVFPGAESGSSTQIESRWAVQRRITKVQDAVLDELGVKAPRGLAVASADEFPIGPFATAPLKPITDEAGRTLVSLGLGTGVSDLFFDRLVAAALQGRLCDPSSPAFVLYWLILEGITTVDDLQTAYAALGNRYRDGDACALEWIDGDGRQQRRHLADPLVIALDGAAARAPFHKACDALVASIERVIGRRITLPALLEAARTRFASVLPGDLAAHVNCFEPLTAVDRRCRARWRTGRALAKRAAKDGVMEAATPSLRARLANAVFFGVGASDLSRVRILLEAVTHACRNRDRGSEHAQRVLILTDITKLAAEAMALGGWVVILYDWLLEFVAVGTRRTSPFAPNSIRDYVGAAVVALLTVLADIDIDRLDEVDWAAARTRVLDLAGPRREHASAAFAAFHEYLSARFGLAHWPWPRDREGAPHIPRAVLLSPAEIADVQAHLDRRAQLGRFEHQLPAVHGMASSSAMREQDWRRCLMEGVSFFRGHWYVTLDPRPGPVDGKTPDARRTLKLAKGPGADAFGCWIERRREEGAAPQALIFADPEDPSKPFEPGATTQEINRILKERTGDPLASIHSLRHSYISLARTNVKSQRESNEVSVRAGHASNRETVRTYTNLYEALLRRHLDEWLRSFDLRESDVCCLADAKPGQVRQRWCRAQAKPRAEVSWALIAERAASVQLPSVEEGIEITTPVFCAHDNSSTITVRKVIAWLRDRADGIDDQVIALKYDIEDHAFDDAYRWMRRWYSRYGDRSVLASMLPLARPPTPFADGESRIGQQKLSSLLDYLIRASRIDVAAAVETWLNVQHNGRIALSALDDARALVALLRTAGVEGDQLVVCHTDDGAGLASDLISEATQDFGRTPAALKCRARSERGDVFLALRAARERSLAPAALSVSGLNALMFCAWLYIQLTEREPAP
jgi:hypothetical protein